MELIESWWTGGSVELGIQGVAGTVAVVDGLHCVSEFLGAWGCTVAKFHIQISQYRLYVTI
jgi:hypothetical protein